MLKWIVLLLLVVGGYFAYENWSDVTSWAGDTAARWNIPLPGVAKSLTKYRTADGKVVEVKANPNDPKNLVRVVWRPREIGGLRGDLPYNLEPYTPKQTGKVPDYIQLENFRAESGLYKIALMHGKNTILRGGLMLAWMDWPLGMAAERLKMDVISKNTATAMVNGFRARRSDFVSRSEPRVHARCVLLERGDQAWFLEFHAPQTDPDAERLFLQMASSVQAL